MKADFTALVWFEDLGRQDVAQVGGKNASLGEMVANLTDKGVAVPGGFATTADAYWPYVQRNGLGDKVRSALGDLESGRTLLAETGGAIRRAFLRGEWPKETAEAITAAYRERGRRAGRDEVDVAVRSSATAEDLPDASFAGQQEPYLNIRGERALLDACRRCYASLFTDRKFAAFLVTAASIPSRSTPPAFWPLRRCCGSRAGRARRDMNESPLGHAGPSRATAATGKASEDEDSGI